MKFKVGDSVTIRKDLKVSQDYGVITLYSNMVNYLGRTAKIKEISEQGNYLLFNYYWSPEMFEPSKPKVITKWTPIKKGMKKYNEIFEINYKYPLKPKVNKQDIERITGYLQAQTLILKNEGRNYEINLKQIRDKAVTKIMRLIK